MKKACLLVTFLLLLAPNLWAYPGETVVEGVGKGTVAVGKGVYKSVEFVFSELLRPIKPLTQWVTRKFGKVESRTVRQKPV